MLSVIYKDELGGETVIPGVTSVHRIPRVEPNKPSPYEHGPGVLVHFADGMSGHYGETMSVSSGDRPRQVFVMNEAGKTVAKYEL